MKIFIAGGAGFIGSNFIRYFIKKYPDYKIIVFDALTYAGNIDNLADLQNEVNYQFIKGDIRNLKFLREILKEDVDA
ncbi:MAG: GDP-mannose 4,6-dehydratase, partial [Armatimonadetes bacterium]|nr:GDP-mannose 4,6-dehydratase [Armatimonadota bacterium]